MKLLILFLFILMTFKLNAQEVLNESNLQKTIDDSTDTSLNKKVFVSFKGILKERGTRKLLSDVNIFLLPIKSKVKTNKKGEFNFKNIPKGKYQIIINLTGYIRLNQNLDIQRNAETTLYLEKESYDLFETTVVGKKKKRDATSKTLTFKEFSKVPGAGGDPIKAIENLPGVNNNSRGARVVIQGAEPEDTRYGFNDHYIPIVFHFGGLTSVVIPEAIESVDFMPAGYGPEFGKALGGVINLKTRSPKRDRYYGMSFVDIFNGGGFIEGPVTEKSSFFFGGRKSWVGAVLEKIAEKSDGFDLTVAPDFDDLIAMYEHKFNDDKKIKVDGIYSKDTLKFVLSEPVNNDPSSRGDFENETNFYRFLVKYEDKLADKQFFDISYAFGRDRIYFKIDDQYLDITSYSHTLRTELFHEYSKKWKYYIGVDGTFEDYLVKINLPFFNRNNGGIVNPFSIADPVTTSVDGTFNELAIYNRNILKFDENSKWSYILGIRLETYSIIRQNESRLKNLLYQPRLAVRYDFDKYTIFKSAFGVYHQTPQESEGNKSTGNSDLYSLKAYHYTLGLEKDFRKGSSDGLRFDSNIFFKYLDNLVNSSFDLIYKDGALTTENYENGTNGKVYGLELSLKYDLGKFNLTTAYTLSRSRRQQSGSEETFSRFDQTHSLNLITSYELGRWTLAFRGRYVTGKPLTPVIGSIFDSDGDNYVPIRGDFYSQRNDPFIQFDLRIDRKWIYDQWILSAYLDIQNLSSNNNAEGLMYSYDYSENSKSTSTPIIPTFGIKGEF